MSEKFIGNRTLYHTFSRVAIQEGQGVAAAVNKTGHTVTTNDVWTDIDKLPKNTEYFGNANTAFDDLKAVYNTNASEFSKYVTLYENVELSPVDGSGQDADKNQAWELLVDGKRIKNFIAPTDVFDTTGNPCNGYTLKLFDKNGTQIAATDGNWAFDYFAGLVIFERGKTPQDLGWAGTTKGAYIKMSAWAYTGGILTNTLLNVGDNIETISGTTIPAIEADITTISGTTIPTIQRQIASLQYSAGGQELFQGTFNLYGADGTVGSGKLPAVDVETTATKDPESGNITQNTVTLSGSIELIMNEETPVDSIVTIKVPGEVIAVKQQVTNSISEPTSKTVEEVYPDMSYDGAITTMTANYGVKTVDGSTVANITQYTSWIITFRVKSIKN